VFFAPSRPLFHILYVRQTAGKTFVALDIGCLAAQQAVARVLAVNGGPVLYIVLRVARVFEPFAAIKATPDWVAPFTCCLWLGPTGQGGRLGLWRLCR